MKTIESHFLIRFLILGALVSFAACNPESTSVNKTAGHAGLKVKVEACVSYFLNQCDEELTLDFGEVPPGEMASVWVRLDNVGDAPLVLARWDAATAPMDLRVTNAFNSDAGPGTMFVLPNRVDVGERLWVSVRLLPGLSPGPLPHEQFILVFEVDESDDYEIVFDIEGEITGCPAGFADCDADMENGCEQDILSDVSNCGACNNVCGVPYGEAACVEGECVFTCNAYYTGPMCDQDINECTSNTHDCDDNAICSNRLEGYNCECNEGYEGDGFTCAPIPVKTDTVSAVSAVRAGEALTVTCNIYDTWNGLMPLSDESWLEVPTGFTVETVSTGVFSVSHTVAGTYALKCHIREVVDDSPLVIEVVPGDPHDWVVVFDDSDCQSLGSLLDYQITVTDYWDNIISNPALSLVTDALEGLEESTAGDYRWNAEDDHQITFSILPPHHPQAESLVAYFDVVIDETPPHIEVVSPARSAMLEDDASIVTLNIEIADVLTPVVSATLNDNALNLGSGLLAHTLALEEDSQWGLNIIRLEATDFCENTSTVVQSYLHASSYYTAATTSHNNAKVTHGLALQLNQPVFDDFDRSDIDDLATLAQSALQNIDLNSMVTNPIAHSDGFDSNGDGLRDQQTFNDCGATCGVPVIGSCSTETHYEEGWWVTKTGNMVYDEPVIEYINATSAGLAVKFTMDNISLPLNVFANYKVTQCTSYGTDIEGQVYADNIQVAGVLQVDLNGGVVDAYFENLSISITNPVVDVDWGGWSWWDAILDNTVGAIGNMILDSFIDDIEAMLEEETRNSIAPLAEDFLGSISFATQLPLGAPLSGTLSAATDLGYATIGQGYGRFGLNTQISPQQKGAAIPEDAKGSLKSGHGTSWFDTGPAGFGAAFKTDFINQAMWATWYGGALQMTDLEGMMDLGEGITIDLVTGLPPVMMPNNDPDWDAALGFGDIYVEANFELGEGLSIPISLYLSGTVDFNLAFDNVTNTLSLVPNETAELWIEVVDIGQPDLQADLSDALEEIFSQVFPALLAPILESIPLPQLDVGGLAGLPSSEVWKLSNGVLEKTDGQIRLHGDLE